MALALEILSVFRKNRVLFIGAGIGILAIVAMGAIFLNLQTMEKDQILEYKNTAMKLSDLTMNFYLKKEYGNIDDMMKVQTQTSAIHYLALIMGGKPSYEAGNTAEMENSQALFMNSSGTKIEVVRKPRFLYFNVPFVESEDIIRKQSSLLVVFSLEEFQRSKRNILWAIVVVGSLVTGLVILFYRLDKVSKQLEDRNRRLDKTSKALQERNQELAETSKKLQIEEQTKTGMIKAIAHDALHYVTVIQMINDNLKAQALQTESKAHILPYVQDIKESNGSLTKLLEDLKYNEYLSSGRVIKKPERTEWINFLGMIITSLKEMFVKKNILCEFFHEKENYMVVLDQELIKRVIFNLLHNAFKFTRQDSKIKVWCHKEENSVITYIQDEGAGIPETEWENIFVPSVRLEDNDFVRPEDKRGTGLGLTNSRKSVELYQGELGVCKSVENVGTTFFLRLPLAPTQ